jgi:hypothetical protein
MAPYKLTTVPTEFRLRFDGFKKVRVRGRTDLFSCLAHPTIAHISSGDTPIAPLPCA